jgi:hypothetical protein
LQCYSAANCNQISRVKRERHVLGGICPACALCAVGALRLPAETVIGVERTRATFLSYTEQDQADFTADLNALLVPGSHIDLVQETFLAMAPTAA